MDIWLWIALIVGSVVAGMVNTLAGGGSLITVPLLMLLGLEPNVANGTNRIAVLVQSVVATWTFHRRNLSGVRVASRMLPSGLVGAGIGAYLATIVSDDFFRTSFALIMLPLAVVTFLRPKSVPAKREGQDGRGSLKLSLLLFPVGLFAGFVQAGVGILLLAVLTSTGLEIKLANSVKVALVAAFTLLALIVFWARLDLAPVVGLILAAGMGLGGYLGSIAALKKGEVWIRRVVFIACAGLALKLLLGA